MLIVSLLFMYSQNLSPPIYHQLSGQSYHQSYLLIVICLIFSESADVFTLWLPRLWLGLQSSLNSSLAALLHSSITCLKPIQNLQYISLFPFLVALVLHWPLVHLKIKFKQFLVLMLQTLHAFVLAECPSEPWLHRYCWV